MIPDNVLQAIKAAVHGGINQIKTQRNNEKVIAIINTGRLHSKNRKGPR